MRRRLTTDAVVLLIPLILPLLLSCGGMGGGVWVPPEPLPLPDLMSYLGEPTEPVAEVFSSEVPLRFVLATDFNQLKRDRSQETEERPGQLLIRDRDGDPVEIPVKVKTRGNFRLKRSTCSDPPLRLNLPETQPMGTVLDGHDKFKLVTHCRDSDRYEQNVLEEYLVYRLYNQVTDIGFRVHLAEITYVDTRGAEDPVTRMAFLIEDEDVMAERLGGMMVESSTARPDDFVPSQMGLMYVFQYMVGNVDWGATAGHNIKILVKDGRYYPIAYDFDWTGLVDAPYAGPNELTAHLHDDVRERVYWGHCLEQIDFEGLFAHFNGKKDAILGMAASQKRLSRSNAESAERYLEEFFDTIANERSARSRIITACRPWDSRR